MRPGSCIAATWADDWDPTTGNRSRGTRTRTSPQAPPRMNTKISSGSLPMSRAQTTPSNKKTWASAFSRASHWISNYWENLNDNLLNATTFWLSIFFYFHCGTEMGFRYSPPKLEPILSKIVETMPLFIYISPIEKEAKIRRKLVLKNHSLNTGAARQQLAVSYSELDILASWTISIVSKL